MHGIRRNWLFVKIETDEGIYGWGEGTLEGHEKAVEQGIYHLYPLIEGRDPTRIEYLWQIMYRHKFWKAGAVMGSAISAIDMALWDITGKAYGQPVYKLLGGAVRDRVRAYTHAEDLRGSKALVDQGFSAFKTGGWITTQNKWLERDEPDQLHEKIKAMRKAVGPEVDIMIDNHGRNRPSQARLMAPGVSAALFPCSLIVRPEWVDTTGPFLSRPRGCSQARDGLIGAALEAEDASAGDHDVGPGRDYSADRIDLDPAVNGHLASEMPSVDCPSDLSDALERLAHERLSSITRLDAHHEHAVNRR